MKKIILTALCAAFCLALCGCDKEDDKTPDNSTSTSNDTQTPSNSEEETLSIQEKAQQLLDEVEFPDMVEITADKLNVYFGIDEADINEFAAYICGNGSAPDEFGIFEAKDASAAASIKAALDKRVQSQYDTFESYTPQAMYRFDDDFVKVNGTTVIYAICDNNAKALEILQ